MWVAPYCPWSWILTKLTRQGSTSINSDLSTRMEGGLKVTTHNILLREGTRAKFQHSTVGCGSSSGTVQHDLVGSEKVNEAIERLIKSRLIAPIKVVVNKGNSTISTIFPLISLHSPAVRWHPPTQPTWCRCRTLSRLHSISFRVLNP